jgi:hypothetical protein
LEDEMDSLASHNARGAPLARHRRRPPSLQRQERRSRIIRLACAIACTVTLAGAGSTGVLAQANGKTAAPQKLDADYTAKIKAATADPRIVTELVDHMPASDKVPSPLKFLGYIPGEPGHMTYYKDIARYLEALDKA